MTSEKLSAFLHMVKIKTQQYIETTVFNPIQIHLLRMFEYDNSPQSLKELKSVLYHYYFGQNSSVGNLINSKRPKP